MSGDSNSVSSGGAGAGGLNLNLPMNYNISSSPSPMTGAPLGSIGGGGNSSGGSQAIGSRLPLSSASSGDLSSGGGLPNLLGGGGVGGGGGQQQLQGATIAGLTNMNISLAPLSSGGMGSAVIGGGVAIGAAPNINMSVGIGGHQQQQVAVGPAAPTPSSGGSGINLSGGASAPAGGSIDELHLLVLQLVNHDQREGVLLELSKKRESFPDLAPILWHTVGTVAALLQEIVSIYPLLTPPTLTAHASNRVCNALALLQCVASHPDTRGLFLNAHVPLYLYPFLNTQSKSRPFEYLRLTSLGVIGALVKMDDADVINFLLQTEIIPLCLRIMEAGSELSKTVATFIVQKILLDDVGLGYVCATAERFYAVSTVLNNMVGTLVHGPSVRLLKHIVRCYLRLSDNARARDALRQALPTSLRDDTFGNALRDDVTVKKWLGQLLSVVGPPAEGAPGNAAVGAPGGAAVGAPQGVGMPGGLGVSRLAVG
eukprot:CAMPEP_0172529896 /NCGR_PEP_ID=MMETSP1067-20121228/3835_1 /TAXON_ID=265564 ORGANISM="Thalassiosira punctigera, Strain Tpunct2005C2" /NCGR_SAMPLE_ID=MMETSP1067 /ASSEMBLY_ACC=CAM_ASM_000444 /LENGTH=483 /DNA_ID=CAMNT_0013314025 /DNA_START=375 /DNA_END=1822 /DNA_ORIENTATION=+